MVPFPMCRSKEKTERKREMVLSWVSSNEKGEHVEVLRKYFKLKKKQINFRIFFNSILFFFFNKFLFSFSFFSKYNFLFFPFILDGISTIHPTPSSARFPSWARNCQNSNQKVSPLLVLHLGYAILRNMGDLGIPPQLVSYLG